MNGAGDIHSIGLLPDKLKTELALHVNLETLRKVFFFSKTFNRILSFKMTHYKIVSLLPEDPVFSTGSRPISKCK